MIRKAILLSMLVVVTACNGDAPASDNQATDNASSAVSLELTAIPQQYVGRWDVDDAACRNPASETLLEIAPRMMRIAQDAISARRIMPAQSSAIEVIGTNDRNGMTVERRYTLSAAGANALDVTIAGTTLRRVRCPQ